MKVGQFGVRRSEFGVVTGNSELRTPHSELPLQGLRVLELGDLVAAPYAGRLLADLGAEVIKVETPGQGDLSRYEGPFPGDRPDPEKSGLFLYLNLNKLGITLDVTVEGGRQILGRLLAQADVLLTNRPATWLNQHGLSPAKLSDRFPRLIVTAVTPFGLTGPYRDHLACDLTVCHGAGVAVSIGDPDRAPLTLPEMIPSYMAATGAATATALAVLAQDLSGAGQIVDVSIAECMSTLLMGPTAVRGHYSPRARRRIGHRVPGYWPDTILPCKDGHVSLIAIEDDQWRRLLQVMGNPDWADDPLFQDRFSRYQLADTLDRLIEPWLMGHTKREIYAACQTNRVPTAPINTPEDVANDPHLTAHGFWTTVDHPLAGPLTLPGSPMHFSATPLGITRPAPLLGQHNDAIFIGRLGYSPEETAALTGEGVL